MKNFIHILRASYLLIPAIFLFAFAAPALALSPYNVSSTSPTTSAAPAPSCVQSSGNGNTAYTCSNISASDAAAAKCTPTNGGKAYLCPSVPAGVAVTGTTAAITISCTGGAYRGNSTTLDCTPSGSNAQVQAALDAASCKTINGGHQVECASMPAGATCLATFDCSIKTRPTNTTDPSTAQQVSTNPCTTAAGGKLGYCPLEPLPGIPSGQQLEFVPFLNAVFRLLIIAGALIAVVTLVYAGISYILSEAFETKGEAKRRMQAALWGLVILLGAWLMLNTINPTLLNFNLSSLGVSGGGTSGANTQTSTTLPSASQQQPQINNCVSQGGHLDHAPDGSVVCN